MPAGIAGAAYWANATFCARLSGTEDFEAGQTYSLQCEEGTQVGSKYLTLFILSTEGTVDVARYSDAYGMAAVRATAAPPPRPPRPPMPAPNPSPAPLVINPPPPYWAASCEFVAKSGRRLGLAMAD